MKLLRNSSLLLIICSNWRTIATLSTTTPRSVSHSTSSTLDSLQKRASCIASSFEEGHFDPWISNCHVQTIGGFFLRDTCPYVPASSNASAALQLAQALAERASSSSNNENGSSESYFWDHRERIDTPDGDWFHADSKMISKQAPTVILLHGLESNSESSLSQDMARAYNRQGMNCVCLNFRGCSGTSNDKLGAYHLGFTDDLRHYLDLLKERGLTRHRVYLSGFSLGANVVLKCLGELGEAAYDYNICGASALCAPLDQERNAAALARPGINRLVYTNNLLQQLKKRAMEQLELHCNGDTDTDKFDFQRAMVAKTITEFDDAFHPKIYGFDDCWDYYRKTSSIHFMENIAVPTLVLNAKDDPFMDTAVWPVEKSCEFGGRAPLKMVRTEHGGHLGFCFHRVSDDVQLADNNDDRLPSWASLEQARFLAHVDRHPVTANLVTDDSFVL